jgi:2-keto-3-deoxy-L-rhamnonate aldolase RhmA
MLPGANHARIMARTGYDWICVDMEHGNIAGMIVYVPIVLGKSNPKSSLVVVVGYACKWHN